jgi:predicted secreted protein
MATYGIINGTKFGLYAGGTKIGYATSASISMNHSLRDTSTKDSGGWRDQLEGQRDWEASVEGMVIFDLDGATISDKILPDIFTSYMATRDSFTLLFSTDVDDDYEWTGTAFLTSISADAPNEDSTTWSASFSGTGVLTQQQHS